VAAKQDDESDHHLCQDPNPSRYGRHNDIEHLGHTAVHRADLEERDAHHDEPADQDPIQVHQPRTRDLVEGFCARAACRDYVAANLGLDGRLYQATQDDEPQRHISDLGAQRRGRDQFSGTYDRSGQNHAGTDPF
jgi:hypothetical protein